jgi:hypothetical protein
MLRSTVVALIATTTAAISLPSQAGAATVTAHVIRLTERLFQYASTGNPPVSGSNSYVGTSGGRIGKVSVSGTVRGTNTYGGGSTFRGKNTIFDPAGSIRISFKATLRAGGAVSASGRFTGGTGKYKGARGRFTFTATQQAGTTYLRILKGRISYP